MKKKVIDLAIIILVYIFFSSIPYDLFIPNINFVLLVQTFSKLAALLFAIVFVRKSKNLENNKNKGNFLIIMLLVPTFLVVFNNQIFISIKHYKLMEDIDWLYGLCMIAFILATAVSEEYIFRKVVLDNLLIDNRLLKVTVSAAIFGVMHIINFLSTFNPVDLLQIVYTAGLGMILGFFYEYGRSLLVPMILHFLYNLMNSYIFSIYMVEDFGLTYYLVAIIDAVVVAGYMVLIYLLFIKKYELIEEKE